MRQIAKLSLFMMLVLAVGCDDSDPVTMVTPDAGGGPGTIVSVAVAAGDFTILAAALERADLIDTLSSTGPFTVFAPNDAAFAASGIALADVQAMDVAELTNILLYHVVSGSVPSSAVTAGPVDSVATDATDTWNLDIILGTTGGVTINGGNTVEGGATVATADVAASNGVIHIIDRVLLPPDIATMAGWPTPSC